MSEETQVAPAATKLPAGKGWNLTPSNMGEAMKYAELIANSDLVPPAYKGKPGNVLIAVQMGQEVGMQPMQAVQNIAVINNHPSIWGDALPALAKRHPQFEYMNTEYDESAMKATCRIKRKGEPEEVRTFSWADCERAGLHTKDTYKKYPSRMLSTRARAWAIRDVFPDALKGLYVAEEAIDITPNDYHVVPTDEELQTEAPTHGIGGLAQHMSTASDEPEDAVIVDEETGEISVDVEALKLRMDEAPSVGELEKISLELNALPKTAAERPELRRHYRDNLNRLIITDDGESEDGGQAAGASASDAESAA